MRHYFFTSRVILIALLVAAPSCVAAQSDPESPGQQDTGNQQTASPGTSSDHPAEHHIIPTFFHDEYRMWTSPFRPSNYDSHTMKKYGLPFILISGALIATDRNTASLLPNTTDQTVWSGRVSQIGATYTLAGITGATYLIGRAEGDDHAREAGFLGMEAVAHSGMIAGILKEIAQRERPLDDGQHGRFWKGGTSFPSGHATSAFAVAAVFSYEYRDHIAVPISAYSVATLVALSRLSARRHWASDIFVGSSMGFLIGRNVYRQHHDSELPGSPVHRASRLVPDVAITARGPGLYWNF
jgi:hypothetical protein